MSIFRREVVDTTESMEPSEYFRILKDSIKSIDAEYLAKQMEVLATHIIDAKKLKQKQFLRKLSFFYDVIAKEQILLHNGFSRFTTREHVKEFMSYVKNVKIIELDRFQRNIPKENTAMVAQAQELDVFTGFVVLFTDYTDNDYKTPEEQEMVKRNRDPIIFGYFKDTTTGSQHERLYYITDWEDEFCDLTYEKYLDKLMEQGIQDQETVITPIDHAYIDAIVHQTLAEAKKESDHKNMINRKKSWLERLKGFIWNT